MKRIVVIVAITVGIGWLYAVTRPGMGYPATRCSKGWGLFDGTSCYADLTPTLRLRYMETELQDYPKLGAGHRDYGFACYDPPEMEGCQRVTRLAWEGRQGRSPLLVETQPGICVSIAEPRTRWPSAQVIDCRVLDGAEKIYDLTPR